MKTIRRSHKRQGRYVRKHYMRIKKAMPAHRVRPFIEVIGDASREEKVERPLFKDRTPVGFIRETAITPTVQNYIDNKFKEQQKNQEKEYYKKQVSEPKKEIRERKKLEPVKPWNNPDVEDEDEGPMILTPEQESELYFEKLGITSTSLEGNKKVRR